MKYLRNPGGHSRRPSSRWFLRHPSTRWVRRNARLLTRLLLATAVLLAIAIVVFHNAILNASARFLISSDPPQKADLIYILGGNYEVRAPAAAALYRQGWAPKILLAREPSGYQENGRPKENFTDITKRILVENGVPAGHITEFFPAAGVRSTADEAHALRLYITAYPASRILLVTSAFHSRRARMALSRAAPAGTRIVLFAVNDSDCTLTNWRGIAYCRKTVETELIKFFYYFFAFWG
ncbi:MAG TPA: YdcF family protein [Bryobacteraceae bacterium]|nr:YdcF family protein [Bryobacteraceae bacterium]